MKFATNVALIIGIAAMVPLAVLADGMRDNVLRQAIVRAGLVPFQETHVEVPEDLVNVGKLLFQTKDISLDRKTACASCHVDRFGSTDGIANAIGTGGNGEGLERLAGGGDIIPRNTLPFWGRGSKGFNVFFWDGKVDASSGTIHSQFAGQEPSSDPLVVAVHLPPVEVGEMVADLAQNDHLEGESVEAAGVVYDMLVDRIAARSDIGPALAAARGKAVEDLEFIDIAEGIAAFIRTNFQLQDNPLNRFAFAEGTMSESEQKGGLIFYGKGRCSSCHNGPYFTDFQFHAIATPQLGFGKNGFGIDYGRYNSTLRDEDRYRFRTPPLWNVTKTAPYFHSGSVQKLEDAILLHVDPLAGLSPETMTGEQRVQFYEQLKAWSGETISGVALAPDEIADLVSFLSLLSFESREKVAETN
ncbi:His-Xaa-Ser system-associated MauG-like protein [Devosia sp.]|uniref:His-Xaa-Ser system-associated MauG-like protein n=1 Tax=Devosia sp. TaxID=1871048 RepID=UPI0025B9AA31|nr:His-Xaa-Ser system-associated MauG-like protein [Devosia sp.]